MHDFSTDTPLSLIKRAKDFLDALEPDGSNMCISAYSLENSTYTQSRTIRITSENGSILTLLFVDPVKS